MKLTGHDIICIASIDWDFNWQGHQEIMARLSCQGNRVLFIENTGIRSPRWKDLPRLKFRLRNWLKSTFGIREVSPNLFIYSPVVFPFPYSRWASWVNRRLILICLTPWFKAVRFRDPIVWTFLPTRLSLALADAFGPKLLIYYCIADFEALHPNLPKIRPYETQWMRAADLIFAQGEHLRARCAQWNAHVSIFPFGVDAELFEKSSGEGPPALRALAKPIVGYVGGLHRHLDAPLVAELARRRPQWSVVLVGPLQESANELAQLPNVYLMGPKPHLEVPAYVKQFDVCLIPYHLNPYTQTVYPTKLNEYLILGKPVVSTPLPEVEAFNARFGRPVTVASGAEGFVAAIDRLLTDGGEAEALRRRAVAKQSDWTTTVAAMCQQMEERLQQLSAARGTDWPRAMRRWFARLRRRTFQTTATFALAALLLFQTPLLWWVASPLKLEQKPRPADAIVVFAGGVGESGQAGQGYQERVQRAVELYQQGWSKNLVFSSGYVYRYQEPLVMKALAVELGVPAEAIFLESEADSTYENILYTCRLLEKNGWRSILLVSSPYHMRRAVWVWKKVAPHILVTAAPVQQSVFFGEGEAVYPHQIRAILHEYSAILYYLWRGYL